MNQNNNIQIAPKAQNNVAIDVIQQIQNKQPPNNSQISELMEKTQHFLDEKKSDSTIPPETLKTLTDFQGVLQATTQLNENKNKDESIQKIILESAHASKDMGHQARDLKNDPSMQTRGSQMGQQVKDLSTSVLQILKMMVTNGQFRSQINSLIGLIQEMFLTESPSTSISSSSSSSSSSSESQPDPSSSVDQENLIKPSAVSNATTGQAPTAEQQIIQIKKEQSVALMGNDDDDSSSQKGRLHKLKRAWRSHPPSEEKKDEMVGHFLSILRQLNENEQFKQGLNDLIDMFQDLRKEAPHTQIQEAASSNQHIEAVVSESKKLIEQFSDRPIDPFVAKVKEFFEFIRKDEKTRSWFDRFVGLLSDSVRNPHDLNEKEFRDRTRELVTDASQLTKEEEFKNRYSEVGGELRAIVYSIKEDEDLKNLQIQTQKFLENFMTTDADGNRHFNGDFLQQMRTFIVPLLIAQLDNIPIPPIQGSNPDMDYYFENMVFSGQEIIPDKIELHTRGDHVFDVKRLSPHHGTSSIFLEIHDIKPVINDIHFKFNRKTFPKLSDDGVANVKITQNRGISLRIALSLAKRSSMNDQGLFRFNVDHVDVDVSKVEIEIVQAKHDFLLKLFTSLYQTRIKTLLEQKISEKIVEALERIENGINNLMDKYPPSRLKGAISQGVSSMGSKASHLKSSLSNDNSEHQSNQEAIQS